MAWYEIQAVGPIFMAQSSTSFTASCLSLHYFVNNSRCVDQILLKSPELDSKDLKLGETNLENGCLSVPRGTNHCLFWKRKI